jgi:ribosome-binding factor A
MTRRIDRVSVQLIRELSEIITEELTDPRLGLITLTHVDVTPDFSSATVWFTVHGGEKQVKATLAALISARRRIRAALGERVHLRRVPEFTFQYDDSIETGMRIYERIQELSKHDRERKEETDSDSRDSE